MKHNEAVRVQKINSDLATISHARTKMLASTPQMVIFTIAGRTPHQAVNVPKR